VTKHLGSSLQHRRMRAVITKRPRHLFFPSRPFVIDHNAAPLLLTHKRGSPFVIVSLQPPLLLFHCGPSLFAWVNNKGAARVISRHLRSVPLCSWLITRCPFVIDRSVPLCYCLAAASPSLIESTTKGPNTSSVHLHWSTTKGFAPWLMPQCAPLLLTSLVPLCY
jgi:hypothetical protein